MSLYEINDDKYGHLVGAKVTGVPILIPSLKMRKNKVVFPVLCGGKEYMCVVWGKTALTLCHVINIGKSINVYGKEKSGDKIPIVYVRSISVQGPMIQAGTMVNKATYHVDKPKIWDFLSKVPVISRLLPEGMRVMPQKRDDIRPLLISELMKNVSLKNMDKIGNEEVKDDELLIVFYKDDASEFDSNKNVRVAASLMQLDAILTYTKRKVDRVVRVKNLVTYGALA